MSLPLLPAHLPEVEAALDMAGDCPPNDEVRAQLEELFSKIDLKKELKRLACGGFDSWEDYEKYGDLFVEVSRSSASGSR